MRALAALALLVGSAAWACPVCGVVDNNGAYQAMTFVMSALPLLMMGGVVGYVAHRVRRAEREENQQRPPPAPPVGGQPLP